MDIFLVTAKCLNWINSASSSIAAMIHCCQSLDPLLQTHSANPFLSTGTCIKRIQFSFSVQVQLENFFCAKKILYVFCHLSFWLLKPFPRFHSWHLWLEPFLWSGNQFSEVQIGWFEQGTSTVLGGRQACRPMWTCYSWTSGHKWTLGIGQM